ncbi:hypothetical protein EYR40_006069 [Pleurotus pulmonarius]|nr:hypothetical protein EYR36_005552 [Pleurotus pulmonarius]KAF4602851.1 hypothetical protein EYR40_006069 [Pleurotus pulmonarius]
MMAMTMVDDADAQGIVSSSTALPPPSIQAQQESVAQQTQGVPVPLLDPLIVQLQVPGAVQDARTVATAFWILARESRRRVWVSLFAKFMNGTVSVSRLWNPRGGKFGESDGSDAALLLATRPPFITLEEAFKKIFSYDAPSIADRKVLGQLGRLPIEIIAQIFAALSIKEALIFGLSHGHIFVIGWPTIKKEISYAAFVDYWSGDRVIHLGDYARTLPEGYLNDEEKFALMKCAIENSEESDDDSDKATGDDDDADSRSRQLAAFKDQTFGLRRRYGLYSERQIKSWRSKHGSVTDLYRCRITLLEMRRVLKVSDVLESYRWGPSDSAPDRFVDSVLVNHTKREYVRAVDTAGRYVLDDAIPLLTVWEDELHGDWAGDRLALPSVEEFEKMLAGEEGWKEKVGEWILNP